jgi:dTDP-4-amino-4,6-dideoxygalactose transaminase
MGDARSVADLAIEGGRPVITEGRIGPRWPINGDVERQMLTEVLESDVWGATGFGSKIDELNRVWAAYCGTRRSVALANGTVTMELALRALGVGAGAEVIVPAWTFMATAAAVLQVGAIPVFVDVDSKALCLDPDAVEAAISANTRAIIPVHFGGHPCDMDRLVPLASRHDMLMIEDAAQAHGASWRGRRMGTFGECGSYSFQQSKNLQCGEGGSIVTDDDALADRLHFSLSKFGRGNGPASQSFVHHELAGNATMTEFQAAIVLAQLSRFDQQTAKRNRAAPILRDLLDRIEGIRPLPVDGRVDCHGCHLFLFRYDAAAFGGMSREAFVAALRAEGVPCFSLYSRPLYEEPMYDLERMVVRKTDLRIRVTDCPATRRAATEVVALPQTLLLAEDEELGLIARAIEKVRSYSVGRVAQNVHNVQEGL